MTHLGDVGRDDHRERADSKAGNRAASEQVAVVGCTGLQRGAEDEDDRDPLNSALATQAVGKRAGQKGAEPGCEEEGRYPPALHDTRPLAATSR